jgi:hypothetical protein
MILPDRKTYRLYPTRPSARTVVVSLPTFPSPHPPLITREKPPLPPHLRLDLHPLFCFLKPFTLRLPRTFEKSPSNTHSPPRPSQTPAPSFNRLYRKSRHCP